MDDNLKSVIIAEERFEIEDHSTDRSFLLMDADEKMRFKSEEVFCKKLQCPITTELKVVTIFGNSGDGKSYTMNHAFFKGQEVFKTSRQSNSFTLGLYAALEPELGVLCLDTEGLQHISTHSNKRMHMLLKALALSDIIIYRSRSERLHRDMYDFLGNASKAFKAHFSRALQDLAKDASASLGPAVIVFHETRHTTPLQQHSCEKSGDEKLREHFEFLNIDITAFSSLRYVGIKTDSADVTDFGRLKFVISQELENTSFRSPRTAGVIFQAMIALNKRFSGNVSEESYNPFTGEYLTCPIKCMACNKRCQHSMAHDTEPHLISEECQYQKKFDNRIELCRACFKMGREVAIERTYTWTHCTVSCVICGELATTLLYVCNEDIAHIRTEIKHVWEDGSMYKRGATHSGQIVLDKISSVCEAFTNLSAQSTCTIKEWCADRVAPSYWRLNSEIIVCFDCKRNFEELGLQKHHCRGCGEGFCDACTFMRFPVPARKWSEYVRVCIDCHQKLLVNPNELPISNRAGILINETDSDISVRRYGETFYNTVSSVASAVIESTKEIIKDTARPDYWVPDAKAVRCDICNTQFGTVVELMQTSGDSAKKAQEILKRGDCKRHHCRSCGQAVCDQCSLKRKPVPDRGWLEDVRVCDKCFEILK